VITALSEKFRDLLAAWVDICRRQALAVTAISVLLAGGSVWYSVTHLVINTDTTDMLSAELPFRKLSKVLSEAFPQFSDSILVVLDATSVDLADEAGNALTAALKKRAGAFSAVQDIAGDPFFRKNGLLYLSEEELGKLSNRLAQAQPFLSALNHDPSLRGLFDLLELALKEKAKGSDAAAGFDLAPALNLISSTTEAQIEGRFGNLAWSALMGGNEGKLAKPRRFILVRPKLDYSSLQPAKSAMKEIRETAVELGLTPDKGVTVRLSGSAALSHEELKSVEEGMGWANIGSLLFVGLLLVIGLKSARLVSTVFVALVIGLLWSAALAFLMVGRLNLISVAFAVLYIGIGVDFGIHFSLRYKEGMDRLCDQAAALAWAARGVGGPLFLCSLAAAIGFYSFLPTAYVGFAELGIIAGTSMFVAFFVNVTTLPALLTLFPVAPEPQKEEEGTRWGVLEFAISNHKLVSLGALGLVLGLLTLIPQARFDFDPLNLKDPKTESVATLFDLMKDKRVGTYSIAVLNADLSAAEKLAQELRNLPEVDSVTTLADYVPKDQEAKLETISDIALFLMPIFMKSEKAALPSAEDRLTSLSALKIRLAEAGDESSLRLKAALDRLGNSPVSLQELEKRLTYNLPGRLAALGQLLGAEKVTMADLPADLRANEIAADGRARLVIYPKENLRGDTEALTRFVESVRTVTQNGAGGPVTIYEAGKAVVEAFQIATIITIVSLLTILAFLLSNFRDMVLVFAPLVLASLMTLSISVLFDMPFNFANVIVLPLLFGLGIANGIQFIYRERLEQDSVGMWRTSTPRAVIFSALTTAVSFGSMAVSSHPGTASMGVLLLAAIILTLICTLFVLPALMQTLPRKG
jgi:hypothetical protein